MSAELYARPPLAGEVIRLATSGTSVRVVVPVALNGLECLFTSHGSACQVVFGGSAVDAVYGEVSAVAAEVITTDVNSGLHVPDGATRRVRMPLTAEAAYMSVEASGAGFLEIVRGDLV